MVGQRFFLALFLEIKRIAFALEGRMRKHLIVYLDDAVHTIEHNRFPLKHIIFFFGRGLYKEGRPDWRTIDTIGTSSDDGRDRKSV